MELIIHLKQALLIKISKGTCEKNQQILSPTSQNSDDTILVGAFNFNWKSSTLAVASFFQLNTNRNEKLRSQQVRKT